MIDQAAGWRWLTIGVYHAASVALMRLAEVVLARWFGAGVGLVGLWVSGLIWGSRYLKVRAAGAAHWHPVWTGWKQALTNSLAPLGFGLGALLLGGGTYAGRHYLMDPLGAETATFDASLQPPLLFVYVVCAALPAIWLGFYGPLAAVGTGFIRRLSGWRENVAVMAYCLLAPAAAIVPVAVPFVVLSFWPRWGFKPLSGHEQFWILLAICTGLSWLAASVPKFEGR